MIAKEHRSKSGIILSLCDDNIIGKKYSENGLVLDLSADFYKGEKVDDSNAEKMCKRAYIINAAGKNAMMLIKKLGLINEKNILVIKNIPFAQCLMIQNEI
jgi:hypothetical protein